MRHVKGVTNWEEIKTYKNEIYSTFKETCIARGLHPNEKECIECLQDACNFDKNGKRLRELFAILLVEVNPPNSTSLWLKFRNELTEDILRKKRNETYDIQLDFTEEMYEEALFEISEILEEHQKTLSDYQLPQIKFKQKLSKVMRRELQFNAVKSLKIALEREKTFNSEQKIFIIQ